MQALECKLTATNSNMVKHGIPCLASGVAIEPSVVLVWQARDG